ncbi:MAG: GDP-mannose 4,6-dehydratase [Victivallaceae bacterium]|nr:GDP-mannose 4,6-dehydratase [Victivallaceae bacterium]
MKYLVTGGAGFIGGHLVKLLLDRGETVRVLDNLSTGSMKNLEPVKLQERFSFVEADVTADPMLVEREVAQADVIYHLAAAVGVELVVNDPVRTILTNVHGTENVLSAAAKYTKRVIVASTSEVYGKSANAMFSEKDDLLIGCPTHSRWSYACSKLLDEFYLMAFHRASRLPGTVVRLFNTVGPRQTGQYGMVIPRFVAQALANRPLRVFGDGSQSRCFCHVYDTIEALAALANKAEAVGQIYNIGSQRSITILDLAKLVIRQLGSSSEIEMIPYEKAYESGFEDMMHRTPDVSAIGSLIEWHAGRSLEEIIADVAAEQQMHR